MISLEFAARMWSSGEFATRMWFSFLELNFRYRKRIFVSKPCFQDSQSSGTSKNQDFGNSRICKNLDFWNSGISDFRNTRKSKWHKWKVILSGTRSKSSRNEIAKKQEWKYQKRNCKVPETRVKVPETKLQSARNKSEHFFRVMYEPPYFTPYLMSQLNSAECKKNY